jgi:hypothetical protein
LHLAHRVREGGIEGEGQLVDDGGEDEELGELGEERLEEWVGEDDLGVAVQDCVCVCFFLWVGGWVGVYMYVCMCG